MPSYSELSSKDLTGCGVTKPSLSVWTYLPEILLLIASAVTPLVAWLICGNGGMLERSGIVMLFFAAVAELLTLNRMNARHLLNACRVKAGNSPWDFSKPARIVGWCALFLSLIGTVITGYGSLIVDWMTY